MDNQNEKTTVQESLQLELKKIEFKLDLRSKNAKIVYPDESFFLKRNSALKKNSAFVKKIKIFTDNNKESIMKELNELNLTKYVGEVACAIVECKIKNSDVNFMLELCTKMNELYSEFHSLLLTDWKKQFTLYKEDKIHNKVKVDLKFFLDLILINVIPISEGTRILCGFINYLISSDCDDYNNLGTLISFLKNCSADLFGYWPNSMEIQINNNLLPTECRDKFIALFGIYYDNLLVKLKDYYKTMMNTKEMNNKILMTKGEVSKEREDKLVNYRDKFEKLNENCLCLSDILQKQAPELKESNTNEGADNDGKNVEEGEGEEDDSNALFEDEDTKLFYQSLCDLKAILPGICYKDIIQVEQKEEEIESETDLDLDTVEKELDNESKVSEPDTADLSPTEEIEKIIVEDEKDEKSLKVKLPFDTFISNLSNCINRELIDKTSQDFCEKYNTKANRQRLAKELFGVSKNRYDLLPFYSRLIANIDQITNEVATDVCKCLLSELKWHVHKKIQTNLESKIKTMRFIGELVKFGVFKKSDCLYCIKILLSQFQHHSIDMLCALLETCGRYLYRSKESRLRTDIYLKIMLKKKNAVVLDSKYVTMIDNAYYYCNPPEILCKFYEVEELTSEQKFFRKILYVDLNKHNNERIFKIVRKFDWENEEFVDFAIRTFTEVWRVKYNNVPYLASVLAGLAPYHENLVVSVIDDVIENIRVGMEINDSKMNQNRISTIRYFGFFYVYKLISAPVVFNVLYSLLSFGVTFENNVESQLDPQDNYFRINLIHTLLDGCGPYFKTGSVGKKLDVYFMYLQQYFLYKKNLESMLSNTITEEGSGDVKEQIKTPFTVLIEGQLYDMIKSLRPNCKVYRTFEEARSSVEKLEAECIKKLNSRSIYLSNNENDIQSRDLVMIEEETGDEDFRDNEEVGSVDNDGAFFYSSDENVYTEDTTADVDCTSVNEVNTPRHIPCQEDEEFIKMIEQLQNESGQLFQNQSTKINVTLPKHIKQKTDLTEIISEENTDSTINVPYAFVTKKLGKNQYMEINVPRDVEFVSKLIETTQQSELQRKSLNKVVLAMHKAQQQEELMEDSQLNTGHASSVTTHDRRYRTAPSKGVPDTSEYFGSNNRRR